MSNVDPNQGTRIKRENGPFHNNTPAAKNSHIKVRMHNVI